MKPLTKKSNRPMKLLDKLMWAFLIFAFAYFAIHILIYLLK